MTVGLTFFAIFFTFSFGSRHGFGVTDTRRKTNLHSLPFFGQDPSFDRRQTNKSRPQERPSLSHHVVVRSFEENTMEVISVFWFDGQRDGFPWGLVGLWGWVCLDGFSIFAASVICRQLGHPSTGKSFWWYSEMMLNGNAMVSHAIQSLPRSFSLQTHHVPMPIVRPTVSLLQTRLAMLDVDNFCWGVSVLTLLPAAPTMMQSESPAQKKTSLMAPAHWNN